ncbi:hypothetical protein GGE06_001956 [Streptomyces sp. SFB5A]|uniref:Uncharacterized protein n=1 Tax=Streptomyces nymphaeiformis TaxID=2663842 RepID=A0A7W7XBD3_9ACTN|nr:hypothetical protein [Streptomyces nymphaeiformis]
MSVSTVGSRSAVPKKQRSQKRGEGVPTGAAGHPYEVESVGGHHTRVGRHRAEDELDEDARSEVRRGRVREDAEKGRLEAREDERRKGRRRAAPALEHHQEHGAQADAGRQGVRGARPRRVDRRDRPRQDRGQGCHGERRGGTGGDGVRGHRIAHQIGRRSGTGPWDPPRLVGCGRPLASRGDLGHRIPGSGLLSVLTPVPLTCEYRVAALERTESGFGAHHGDLPLDLAGLTLRLKRKKSAGS